MVGCRIATDWTYKGMRTLIIENEYLRVVSLLDKGSDIIEILYKPFDIDFMWHSPLGYRNPSMFIESRARSDGSFLDYYGGGWQDILPNAGGSCVHRGAELGQHGETSLMPWNCGVEKDGSMEVVAHLRVDCCRYPFSVDKWLTMRRGEMFFTIRERVTNKSEQDLEFSWLQHVAFGEPFLSPSTTVNIEAETAVVHAPEIPCSSLPAGQEFTWPNAKDKKGERVDLRLIPKRDSRAHDLVYIADLKEGRYELTNTKMKLRFGLVWDKNIFPYVWFWRPLGGSWDHPWFGRAWAIALEPCTSWPATGLVDQIKSGTAAKLKGTSTVETEIKAEVGLQP